MTMASPDNNDRAPPNPPRYEPTSPRFRPRFAGPPPASMTPDQRSLRASILASRPRTGLSGPFGPWLAVPAIARPAQELGRTVRYETSLSPRESELVILLTGARFRSEAEFDIHVGEARNAGLGWDVIRSIPRGALPSEAEAGGAGSTREDFSLENVKKALIPMLEREHGDGEGSAGRVKAKERELAIVLFTAELLDSNTVSDETYATTKQALDGEDSVLVEITSIVGYYAYVAYTLNVFKIPSAVDTDTLK